MSHYFGAVIVPPGTKFGDVQQHVELAMAPHRENFEVEPSTGFWDWWQIGGLWTGTWSGYDPRADESLTVLCRLCKGTGWREDAVAVAFRAQDPEYGCNGCGDTGRERVWPSKWPSHAGDLVPVAHLLSNPDLRRPYTLVVADGPALEKESWNGEDWVETEDFDAKVQALLERHRNDLIVIVDYHS